MADEKKKMSVAEILAAARKGAGGAALAPRPTPAAEESACRRNPSPAAPSSRSESAPAEKPKPAAKPARRRQAERAGDARLARAGKGAPPRKPAEEKPAAAG